jgi:WD40 repeat protein
MRSHRLRRPGRLPLLCGGLLALLCATLAYPEGGEKPQPAPKAAPPGAAALAKARAVLKGVFKQEYADAQKSDLARRTLALKVFAESKLTREDPALRYVGFEEARDLAAASGDLRLAFNAIAELDRHHVIDAAAMRVAALQTAAKSVEGELPLRLVTETALRFVNDAVAADQFDTARRLLKIADQAATRSRVLQLVSKVARRGEQVERVAAEHKLVQPVLEKLKEAPDDAAANQAAGRYYALVRGNWDKGLPLLARGTDATLRALAKRDLANPTAGVEQLALADDWVDQHGTEQDAARLFMLLRAVHWYRLAAGRTEGLSRRYAETQVRSAMARVPPAFLQQFSGAAAALAEVRATTATLTGHTDNVMSVAIAPDGRRAASAGWDRTIRVWELAAAREERRLDGHAREVESVSWSPDGLHLLSCGQDATVRLWDVQTGKELRQFVGHSLPVFHVTFSPEGTRALTAGADGTVRLWDVRTGSELAKLTGHRGGVNRVAFAPDGRQALSGGADATARLWDLEARKEVRVFSGHAQPVWGVAFSPDGDRVATASNDRTVRVWDVATGKEARKLTGHKSAVVSLAYTGDGRRLVSGGDDGTVRIWDPEAGKELQQLSGHEGGVYGLAVVPGDQQIVTGGMDRGVRVWGAGK